MPRVVRCLALFLPLLLLAACTFTANPVPSRSIATDEAATDEATTAGQSAAAAESETATEPGAGANGAESGEGETTPFFGINLGDFSLWVNLLIFAIAAAVVWFAGTQISYFADSISERTGLDKAFMGLIFVALATELPEIATTISAVLVGDARLATSNIFGGIVLQTAILAIVDVIVLRSALTFIAPRPILLLQGVFLILLIGLTLVGIVAGEFVTFFHVGGWTIFLFAAYLVSLYLTKGYVGNERWQPVDPVNEIPDESSKRDAKKQDREAKSQKQLAGVQQRYADWSLRKLILSALFASAFILAAGFVLARSGEVLALQTGLGSSFVGATLLATSTSLPELSTSMAAVRIGSYSMAISNIFGSNSIMILLLFIADIFYTPGPILAQVEASSLFTAAMGIVVTAVYLAGMIEWKNRTIFRMGIDSAVVMVLYVVNIGILYLLR